MSWMAAFRPNRRRVLGLVAAAPFAFGVARAAQPLDGAGFGLAGGVAADQSKALQIALGAARAQGRTLLLPGGQLIVSNIDFPDGVHVAGQPDTVLLAPHGQAVGKATNADNLLIEDVTFNGDTTDETPDLPGLLQVEGSSGVTLRRCRFSRAGTAGLLLTDSGATIEDCGFEQLDLAIFSNDSRGLTIRGNRIEKCGNGGILIWRDAPGHDGSIVTGNAIAGVLARSGGSGQNGNGINLFRADDVIVADNVISDCDFSAVRANTTRNAIIRNNNCRNMQETAIWSEFAFSGSVIEGNVIDGAASGISITNLAEGGTLATCNGNIVRNLAASSTNPDARPVGIYVESETTVVGNTVSAVPGIGILAGNGPYLKDVLIADNVVTGAETGIAISVVEGIGAVRVAGNMIAGAQTALAGMRWQDVASRDLAADAGKFPGVSVEGNVVAS